MVIDVVMPKMGESITEGTILEWRKTVGESIETDEILLEIGTDKVDSEIPSPTSGRIITLLAELNEVVEVGKVIAQIETDVDSEKEGVITPSPTSENKSEEKQMQSHAKKDDSQEKIHSVQSFSKEKGRFFTPVVKKIALKEGIDFKELNSIPGTGSNHRVTKQDVLLYVNSRRKQGKSVSTRVPEKLVDERVEMDHMRKLIAEHMR